MSRLGSSTPYVSLSVFRPIATNLTKPYTLITPSLLGKYAAYFFLPKRMYALAFSNKGSVVPEDLTEQLIRVYRGRQWKGLKLSEVHIGFKLGSFVKSRIMAVFRQKAARKKKPTTKAATSSLLNEAKIYKIRQVKAGQRRKTVGQYSAQFDAQFQSV